MFICMYNALYHLTNLFRFLVLIRKPQNGRATDLVSIHIAYQSGMNFEASVEGFKKKL